MVQTSYPVDKQEPLCDELPDAKLFKMEKDEQLDLTHYLQTRELPQEWTLSKKRSLVIKQGTTLGLQEHCIDWARMGSSRDAWKENKGQRC